MEKIRLLLIALVIVTSATLVSAQKDKSKRASLPAQVSDTINGTIVTIDYSRPSKRGRVVFGGLEEYGKVWRTGANESTWVEVSDDVMVEGEKLPAGKYGIFTIPGEDQWTIIFNEKWDGWGAYEYNEDKDVLRVKVPSDQMEEVVEVFTINLNEKGLVTLAWDQTKVSFRIE